MTTCTDIIVENTWQQQSFYCDETAVRS